MARLDRPGAYAARIHTRGGARAFWDVPTLSSLSWSRVLDDASDAQVVLPKPRLGSRDWTRLGQVSDWAHELTLYRDAAMVWQGPVQTLTENASRVTIDAKDVVAYLDRLPNQNVYDLTQDAATLAQAIVLDGLGAGDPGIGTYMTVTPAGVTAARQTTIVESVLVGAELRELAKAGLDFYTVGRRLVLQGEAMPASGYRLRADHFAVDLEVIRSGASAVTRAIVVGEGVRGTSGGVDQWRGTLAKIIKADREVNAAVVTTRAQKAAAAGAPPVMLVRVPDQAQLLPHAPISIGQLVPGARIDVAVEGYVLPAAATLRLVQVKVVWAGGVETVSISLAPTTTGGEE